MNKDLKIAKKTVQTEIQALKKLSLSFNIHSNFSKAVNLLLKMKGKQGENSVKKRLKYQ